MKNQDTPDLSDFFSTISIGIKESKIKKESLVGDSFDSLFLSKFDSSKKVKSHKETKEVVTSNPSDVIFEEKSIEPNYVEPPTKKNKDPLTPLDQNFLTIEEFNRHYKIFLNRVQQQLSTLGGGGESNLTYMDVPVKYVTSSTYQVTHKDYYIGVSYSGAATITLPKADREGKIFVVKDELGEASRGTNRYITILPSGNDLIDGRDRAILAYDYGSLTFIWRGNSWRVI